MTDTTRTLAEALHDLSGDDIDAMMTMHGSPTDHTHLDAAAAILATPAGRRLTTTDDPRLVALRDALTESDRHDGHGAWCDYLVAPCDCGYRQRHDAARAALGGPDDD